MVDLPSIDIGGDFAKIAIFVVVAGIMIMVGINISGQLTNQTTQANISNPSDLTSGDSNGGNVADNANDDSSSTYWEDLA